MYNFVLFYFAFVLFITLCLFARAVVNASLPDLSCLLLSLLRFCCIVSSTNKHMFPKWLSIPVVDLMLHSSCVQSGTVIMFYFPFRLSCCCFLLFCLSVLSLYAVNKDEYNKSNREKSAAKLI